MTPDQYTNKEFFIDVGDGHQLYVHDWGNPKGLPVVCLHGGPGNSVNDKFKGNFDPAVHRVIFFDQRGCGKSLPYGSLEHNTTADLVEDIEKIAKHLKLTNFAIQGGSWGSCLALAYALKYPKRVRALVLFGVFTGSQEEIDYIEHGRFASHFPEVWQRYLEATPKEYRHAPSDYHFKRILGDDEAAARKSACAYQNMEGALIKLDDRFTPSTPDDPAFDPTSTKIEVHYIANRCFMPDNYVMDNAHKLTMPIWIAQGRYDMVCPPMSAYKLQQKLPHARLFWTIDNHLPGHETIGMMRAILLQLPEGK